MNEESLYESAQQQPDNAAEQQALEDAEARDQEFLARFEEIRLKEQSRVAVKESHFTAETVFLALRDALHGYGIVIGAGTPAQAAARIQNRPEPVRRELLAALDEYLLWMPKSDPQTRQWLLDALAIADKDVWRRQARKAAAERDWKTLEPLARQVDVRKQTPSSLLHVAAILPDGMKATRLDLLRRPQRAYPSDLWANHQLARELWKSGQPAEAISYYTAALALRPDNPGIYLNRGGALSDAKELDAAISDYRHALALAPQYAAAHHNLGTALRAKGRLDEAIAEYREAIRIKKDYPEAHYNLGKALSRKGQLEDTIAEYREAIRIRKDYPEAHCNLGGALQKQGKFQEALKHLRRGHELGSKNPRWRYPSAQWVQRCEQLAATKATAKTPKTPRIEQEKKKDEKPPQEK